MASWALPRPLARSDARFLSDVVAAVPSQADAPPPSSHTTPASFPKARRRRVSPSPFMPKSKGKGNDAVARLSEDDLVAAIDKTEAALKRAGTSAASAVLTKRLDSLQLELSGRRLLSINLNGTADVATAETPEDVRQHLERMRIREDLDTPSLRDRSARALSPRLDPGARIGTVDWDEGERLLKEEWKRDMELRRANEELEVKRIVSHRPLRGAAAAKHEALQQFMFSGAADDDDTDDESLEDEME